MFIAKFYSCFPEEVGNKRADELRKCVYCDKKAKVQCEECNKVGKEVLYCSEECLNKDKERHKIFCALILVLPDNIETKPYLTKIQYTKGWKVNRKQLETILGETVFGRSYIELGVVIGLVYRDDFSKDGSKLNPWVEKIKGNLKGHQWKGPIVAIKRQIGTENVLDIEPSDFTDIVDFFVDYAKKTSTMY
uniref:MYND-type domain-containing protein n=1 Tax=Meloidogyne javanica TaxID=6303 RepID=A0A915MYI4_MELJA